MPTDQEFRDLCARVIHAQAPGEFESAISDLKVALRDRITDAENKGIYMLLDHPKLKAQAAKEGAEK